MIRDTSIQVYHQIKEEGLLSERRFQVYETLFHYGPLTAGEIWNWHLKATGAQLNSISPRTAELERRGVIKPVEERLCRVTGRTCIAWDVTSKLPIEPEKKRIKRELAELDEVWAAIEDLRKNKADKRRKAIDEDDQLPFNF